MVEGAQPEFILAGVVLKRLISGAETGGQLCLFETTSQAASQTPVHLHANDDETIHMTEGEMQVIVAGVARIVKAGETVFLRRQVAHQLINASGARMRYILVCTPAGFDDFVAEAGRPRLPGEHPAPPTAADIARLKDAAPKYGITLLPGW